MNPAGTITTFALFCVASGYLWTEGCISLAARQGIDHPTAAASVATTGAPLLVLGVVVWLAWALLRESDSDTRPKKRIHVTAGIIGCVLLFLFCIYAGLSMFGHRPGPLSPG